MAKHAIESIMSTTLEELRRLVDVTTVVGEPIQTADGMTILPVSKVALGFVAGGAEYGQKVAETDAQADAPQERLPFGGGAGAGANVQPVAFLVVGNGQVRMLPVEGGAPSVVERVLESAPKVVQEVKTFLNERKADRASKKHPEIAADVTEVVEEIQDAAESAK